MGAILGALPYRLVFVLWTIISLQLFAGLSTSAPFNTANPASYFNNANLWQCSGCSSAQQAQIASAYGQAMQVISSANDAIKVLENPRPATRNGKRSWDLKAEAFLAFFGMEIDANLGANALGGNDQTSWNRIKSNFNQIYTSGTAGSAPQLPNSPAGTSRTYVAEVGVAGFVYHAPNDQDPYGSGTVVGTYGTRYSNGMWTYPGEPSTGSPATSNVNRQNPDPNQDLCIADHTIAFTMGGSESRHFWLCALALTTHMTVDPTVIRQGDELLPSPGRGTGVAESLALTFVHELTHLFTGPFDDDNWVADLPSTLNPRNDVYGYTETAAFALEYRNSKNLPGPANTADAYNLFAWSTFLDQWNWAPTGTAQPI